MPLGETLNRILESTQQERRDEQSQLMQLAQLNIQQNQERVNKLYDAFTRSQAREDQLTNLYLETVDKAASYGIIDKSLNDLPMRTKDSDQIVGMNKMRLAEQAGTYQKMIEKNRQDQQDLSDAIVNLTQQTAGIRGRLFDTELAYKEAALNKKPGGSEDDFQKELNTLSDDLYRSFGISLNEAIAMYTNPGDKNLFSFIAKGKKQQVELMKMRTAAFDKKWGTNTYDTFFKQPVPESKPKNKYEKYGGTVR